MKTSALIKLNELNGAPIGTAHISDHSCAMIIAKEMMAAFVSNVKLLDVPISIALDESAPWCTDMSVYAWSVVIFDIVELDRGTDAESISSSLKESLQRGAMDDDFLKKKLDQHCQGWSSCRDRERDLWRDLNSSFLCHFTAWLIAWRSQCTILWKRWEDAII